MWLMRLIGKPKSELLFFVLIELVETILVNVHQSPPLNGSTSSHSPRCTVFDKELLSFQ